MGSSLRVSIRNRWRLPFVSLTHHPAWVLTELAWEQLFSWEWACRKDIIDTVQ